MSNGDPSPSRTLERNSLSHSNKHKFVNRFRRLFDKFVSKSSSNFADSVSAIINESNGNTEINEEERSILRNMITFQDLEASDVMIPRTDIISVPIDITPLQLKKVFLKEAHTRLPVYKNNIDEVEGFIHLKDYFKVTTQKEKFKIKDIVREIIFVPGTIKVSDLLAKMKQSAIHIAIVLDEYGGTKGLITIEDIIEELVGDINDEYDDELTEQLIQEEKDDSYLVDAKTEIADFEKYFSVNLSNNEELEYDTIAGMVITLLGRIPKKGEMITDISGFEIEVVDATNRKIKKFRVKKL